MISIIIMYVVYRALRYSKKTNKILTKQNNEIERQRDEIDFQRKRSDDLLLNILPDKLSRTFFFITADFANQDDRIGIRICIK